MPLSPDLNSYPVLPDWSGTLIQPGGGTQPGQWGTPLPPTWETVAQLQGSILALQTRIMELMKDVERLKNTREWLTGDSAGTDSGK